jgi:hypothetical protein
MRRGDSFLCSRPTFCAAVPFCANPCQCFFRLLSHGLIILVWTAIPLAIGVTLARARARPFASPGHALGLLFLLGALLVASFTGYLGPSQGPANAQTFTRFRVLHYGLFPGMSIALVVIWWYCQPEAERDRQSKTRGEIPAEV